MPTSFSPTPPATTRRSWTRYQILPVSATTIILCRIILYSNVICMILLVGTITTTNLLILLCIVVIYGILLYLVAIYL